MKNNAIPFILGLCLFAVQSKAQMPSDTTATCKSVSDSIPDRQDPNNPNPDPNPDDPPGLIWGDTFDPAFSVGTKSIDFTYSDTRNTRNFTNQYNGCSTNDVFYTFTLTVPMNVTITHQGSILHDTYMSLLAFDLSLIESNNNYSGEGHCTDTCHAFIQHQLAAGTYYVVSEGNSNNGFITTNITGNTSGSFNYPSIPSTYSTEPGTAVGGMGGTFGVSPMGGATYSIPIEVPPGLGDMQPNLSIVYNSQSGNGMCGYGANLSGISVITRGVKDIYHDESAQGMKYLADDALYLDGVRLILVSGTAGQEGAVYTPESDPFTVVISHGTCTTTSNNTWFEVRATNGIIYRYGYNDNTRLTYTEGNSQRIYAWYLYRAQRTIGNHMTYSYMHNDNCLYPYQIFYGGNIIQNTAHPNVVEFTYETRNDSVPIRFDGHKGSMKNRLTTITTKTNNSTYRTYNLNYNTTSDGTAYKFSRLSSVTEKNGQNESLPSTQLNWSYLPTVNYSSNAMTVSLPSMSNPFVTFPFSDQNYMSGDFNGDGLSDIVGIGQAGEPNNQGGHDYYTYVYMYYASLSSSGYPQYLSGTDFKLPPYVETGLIKGGVTAMSVIDIEGDGINELLVPYFVSGSTNGTLGLYVLGQNYAVGDGGGAIGLYGNDKPLFASGDLDNDGRTDVVFMETTKHNNLYPLYIWSYNDDYIPGSNSLEHALFEMNINTYLSLDSEPKYIFVSDMNGNGLNDLFVVCADGYAIYWNQGGELSSSTYSDSKKITGSNVKDFNALTLGDFNGDRLIDVIAQEDTYHWYFYLNNGSGGFSRELAYTYSSSYQNVDCVQSHCEIVDYDNDGRSDVVMTERLLNSNYQFQHSFLTHTSWLCSTGTSLLEIYNATSVREEDARIGRYITGDFDGDGHVELVNYGYDCVNGNNSDSDPVWRIYKNSNLTVQSGKVTSVTGDFGVTTNIMYSTLADQSVYTRGAAEPYPAPRYTIPMNVVKQTIQNNGAAGNQVISYSYTGLKIHLQGKGLLGFNKTIADNATTGVKTENGITQWDNTFYIPKITYSKITIDSLIAQTVNTLAIVDKEYTRYFAYPSVSVNTDMDGYSVTTHRHYNTDYGYIISDTTFYGTNMFRATRYHNYTEAGAAFHPQTIVTGQRHPDDNSGAFTRTTTYLYNNHGFVTRKTENKFSEDSLVTEYAYDLYGNMERQTSTGSGITTPCTTRYSYDDTHRFPLRVYTDPASSVHKYTYDPWGNVLAELDSINASRTDTISKNTYDGWGNIVRTEIPGRGEVTYTRGWNNDAGKRYFVLTQGTARPWVKTWFDNQGRKVCTESVGGKDVEIVSATSYNIKGQVEKRLEKEGDLSLTFKYWYDIRGRIIQEEAPGSSVITYTYSSNGSEKTVSEDDNGNSTTTVYDAWGNVKSVTDPISTTVMNKYSSNGGIKETISSGATWTFQYDDRGNRTSMTDPDAGTTTYTYDALGRERSRTDANNIVNVTNYDYLGRVTSSASVTYTYGTSGTDQMRLKSKSYGGWTETYEYDTYGNVTHETMSNGTDITRHRYYSYNANGLLTARTLPGNMTYGYTYDAYGNLTGVNGAGGAVQWSLAEYTGCRTVSNTVLNGYNSYPFATTHLLDQYGQLDSIRTCQNGGCYQSDDYNFSPVTGNLMTVNNRTTDGEVWSFVYDNADRLTKVRENNQDIMEMTYAANGNITSKTGMGSYTYNPSKPHAVDTVSNTAGGITLQVQDVGYNRWNKVASVWAYDEHDFYSYSIGYGPNMQRVTSEMHKTYQEQYKKFYWDDYEEKVVGTDTLHYYYVYGADGLAGLHIVKTGPNTQTTTHTTKVITDHLGSIVSLIDNSDWAYDVQYDVWGNRNVMLPYDFDPTFDRGYTGHEHIDVLNLINMNGRMYDPLLGRFLSPDPYIQSPTNPQNFNRYSYCLNNPLKYSDPDGEFVIALVGAILFTTGMTNVCIQACNGSINSVGDALNAFVGGVAAGVSEGTSLAFAFAELSTGSPFGVLLGHSIIFGKSVNFTTTSVNSVLHPVNAAQIFLGRYYTDENGNVWDQTKQGLSRFLWEGPQTWAGYNWSQIRSIGDRVDEVDYLGGATFCINEDGTYGSVSLGNYINADIDGSYNGKITDYPVLMHEYGHTFDSREAGPAYLFTIGIPSAISASNSEKTEVNGISTTTHKLFWTEQRASLNAYYYFNKYYGVKITDFKYYLPYHQP